MAVCAWGTTSVARQHAQTVSLYLSRSKHCLSHDRAFTAARACEVALEVLLADVVSLG